MLFDINNKLHWYILLKILNPIKFKMNMDYEKVLFELIKIFKNIKLLNKKLKVKNLVNCFGLNSKINSMFLAAKQIRDILKERLRLYYTEKILNIDITTVIAKYSIYNRETTWNKDLEVIWKGMMPPILLDSRSIFNKWNEYYDENEEELSILTNKQINDINVNWVYNSNRMKSLRDCFNLHLKHGFTLIFEKLNGEFPMQLEYINNIFNIPSMLESKKKNKKYKISSIPRKIMAKFNYKAVFDCPFGEPSEEFVFGEMLENIKYIINNITGERYLLIETSSGMEVDARYDEYLFKINSRV